MKYSFLILLFPLFTKAQVCRYNERIFTSFTKTANIVYGNAPALNSPYLFENSTFNQNLTLDIFQPAGDTAQKRALILFAHSGGFLNGTKDNEDMQALCDTFSHYGYVTASINYRLGFNVFSSSASERAVWRGIQDASAAVRFFKQNAVLYKIDTTKIFLWGSSAGSFMALGLAYIDDAERPASTYSGTLRPDLGCKNCTGNNFTYTSLVSGIISCWGATGDTAWIQNNNNIPAQLFHGTADATVPFTEGYPFGLSTIAYVRGSQQINEQLNRTAVYHELYSVAGAGHEYWGTSNGTFDPGGPTMYWQDIIIKARNFMIGRMSGVPSCGPLPVLLTSFAGEVSGDEITLYWNTALEIDLKTIIVERSLDGLIFEELIKIAPKGNNGNGANYSTTDIHPYPGINFYRLKLVDDDGSYKYSEIINLKTKSKGLIITQSYPNPVHNRLNIQLQARKSMPVSLSVFDFTGKIFFSNEIKLKEGISTTAIPFENAVSGIYFVQVKNLQDGISITLKIIKE